MTVDGTHTLTRLAAIAVQAQLVVDAITAEPAGGPLLWMELWSLRQVLIDSLDDLDLPRPGGSA